MDDAGKASLLKVEKRVNQSRDNFIEELKAHDSSAGNRLIEEFLHNQLGPSEKRSPIAQQEAKETIELIRGFNAHAASISSRGAIASMALQQTLLWLQLDVLEESLKQIGQPGGAANLNETAGEAAQRAVQCGEHIAFVQRLSAAVLLTHRCTLLEFGSEALDVRWDEVASRIRRELAESTRTELFDESFEFLTEQLTQLAADISEEYLDGFRRYWRMARRLIGKNNIPTFGKTDVTQRLLHELRQQERAIADLYSAYETTLQALQNTPSDATIDS